MKFSLRLNNDHAPAKYIRLVQAAEAAGFDQFWVSNDVFFHSAPVILTAVAMATTRIEIGTCIVNPYTLNPAEIAMMAATLDEISNGRFNLGISSGAADFLGWLGIATTQPRTAVLESIEVIHRLMQGERVAYDGKFLRWNKEAYLRIKPSCRVPVYLGAMSPKMLASIGQVADGGLPLLFPPEHYETVLPYIRAGAESAGRNIEDIDVAACIWISVAADKAAAEDVLKEKIAYYGHALSPMILANLGLTHADFGEIERVVMRENNLTKAKSLVTPAMLKIGIAGTTHDLIERLEYLVALGVRHLSFGPPLGPDLLGAITMLGRDVIPHFRGRV